MLLLLPCPCSTPREAQISRQRIPNRFLLPARRCLNRRPSTSLFLLYQGPEPDMVLQLWPQTLPRGEGCFPRPTLSLGQPHLGHGGTSPAPKAHCRLQLELLTCKVLQHLLPFPTPSTATFFFPFFFLPQIFINPSEFHFLKYLFSLSFSVHIRFLLFQGKNAAEQKKLSILAQNKTIKKLHFCLLPLSSEDISLMLSPQTTPNPACSNPCCESDRAPPSRLKLPGDDRPH